MFTLPTSFFFTTKNLIDIYCVLYDAGKTLNKETDVGSAIYVLVCMHACMYAGVYLRIYIYEYICMHEAVEYMEVVAAEFRVQVLPVCDFLVCCLMV